MTVFGELDPETGAVINQRTIPQSALLACPYAILMAEHYRDDDSCRCDDPDHVEMATWGYRWNGERWVSS